MSKKHKYFNLYQKIISEENIRKAYKQVLRGNNKYCNEAIEFHRNETRNLNNLIKSLEDESYRFDGYTSFYVYEPKKRLINAPGFKDKIVQIAINNVLKHVYYKCFIKDSYGSIDFKGTHRCAERNSYFLRKAYWKWGAESYITYLDIEKFFYSINRDILKGLYERKIGCQKTLWLLFEIIDSADKLGEKGLPLGNTISQLSANVYMNELDQFVKRKLRVKFYTRYMDDMMAISRDKEAAKEVMQKASSFIENKLDLRMNEDKTKIFPIEQGINSIGYKTYATHRLLRNQSKKKIKRKAKKIRIAIKEGRMTVEKAEQIFNSWHGHAKYCSSHNFINSLIEKNDYLTLTDRGIKIIKNKI